MTVSLINRPVWLRDIGPDGLLWMGYINVVPKREWDEQKK
jgi:hypothetical protein